MSSPYKGRFLTLSRYFERFLEYPSVLELPEMWVETASSGERCFVGSGEIRMRRSVFEFVLHGRVTGIAHLIDRIRRARQEPWNVHAQFRLCGIDYSGVDWNAGYVDLNFGPSESGVQRLSGMCSGLLAGAQGSQVGATSSVELIFDRQLRLPIPLNMVTSVVRGDQEVSWSRRAGTKMVEAAGTFIEFSHDERHDALWVIADTSETFVHPMAENWISEPLRILLGEQVYPRLVARNFGDGRAHIWVHRAPGRAADSLLASILEEDPYEAGDEFWRLYSRLLTMVARHRDELGGLKFETHPLTQYYDEVIAGANSSQWAICMTLASAIEGIAKMTLTRQELSSTYVPAEVDSLRDHVANWKGSADLKSRLLGSLDGFQSKGIGAALGLLVREGKVTRDHVKTWVSVRNQVMHGELVPPWPDQAVEGKLRLLVELLHRTSKVYVERQMP